MDIHSFDIREYLDAMTVHYWEAGQNVSKGWIGIQCIHCDDAHNHMGINLYYKNFSCWKCEAKGSLIDLICDIEGVSYPTALVRIEQFQSAILQEPEGRTRLEDDGQGILPYGCNNNLAIQQEAWLLGRRYSPPLIQKQWGILAGPLAGIWSHRIICPVELDGRIMTWIGIDTIMAEGSKYKAAPVEKSYMPTSELLYGADHVKGGTVLMVEGMLDAWRMGHGTVAVLGMNVNDLKLNLLAILSVRRYVIMFDGEEQAIQNAHALGKSLRHMTGREVDVLELAKGDPDDMSDEDATAIREDIGL